MRINETNGDVVIVQLNTVRMNPYMLGRVIEITESTVVFQDAYSLIFDDKGSSFQLHPFNPLGGVSSQGVVEEEFEIPRSLIITMAQADDQFRQALTKKTTGIQLAGANELPKE